jgi:catechol 2,3-dioxygenase-like lactoylglutathione lyase family enzyme
VKPTTTEWFARPVLFVADIHRTLDFYVNRLGFTESWRHEDDGKALVAQVDRQGCALIFSSQWPDKAGTGVMFVSLNVGAPTDQLNVEAETAVLDALRAELEGNGVKVDDGEWGYRLLVVRDPDGNELWFNYPNTN